MRVRRATRIQQGVTVVAILALIVWAAPTPAAEIRGVRFIERLQVGDAEFVLANVGLLRYRIFINAYVAGLYVGAGYEVDRLFDDVPKRLEIEYFYGIAASGFANATDVGIAANVDARTFDALKPRIARLNGLYRDVQPGDRYALTYLPGSGTELALNGKRLGVIEGADFAVAVFSIWLGAQPLDEPLKAQLLG